MTRTTKTRTTPARRRSAAQSNTALTPRVVVLAGIGAVSLCRKQALSSIDGLAEGAEALRQRADAAAREAGQRVESIRKQAKAKLSPVQKQAATLAKKAQAEFETRFAPVLAKLGAKPAKAKRPARTAKRSARPAAKRSRKRA